MGSDIKRLLNISTHQRDIDVFGDDWSVAAELLAAYGLDGFELYPVFGYAMERIPGDLIVGLHLRFLPFLGDLWLGGTEAMLQTFGDLDTAAHFFGGLDRQAVVDLYREQIDWGAGAGAEYAVFHAGRANFGGLVDWAFPWTWEETVDLCADVVNAVTADRATPVPILFENLWWPGGMRLDRPEEIDRLLSRVTHPNTGIVLDTGHVLNKNQGLTTEAEAIDYLCESVRRLGPLRKSIRAVHLTLSLSSHYVRQSREDGIAMPEGGDFWARFGAAHLHVSRIDQHDAFTSPEIARLFDLIEPEFVVHELSFADMPEWRSKIQAQVTALRRGGR
jgi:sugar phosphate isomerase/epimerase